MINIGFTAAEIREAGFTHEEIITGLEKTRKELKELKTVGFTAKQLKKSRFDNERYQDILAKEFRKLYTLPQLKDAGFTVDDLRNRDENPGTELQKFIDVYELKDLLLGFGYEMLADIPLYSTIKVFNELPDKYLNARAAKFFYNRTIKVADFKRKRFTASIMRVAEIPIAKILEAFNINELRNGGFSATELKNAGVNVLDLKLGEYSAAQLKEAMFSASELRSAGFSVGELKSGGFTASDLRSAGFDERTLKNAEII